VISHLSPRGISRIEPTGMSPKDLGRQEQHHPVTPSRILPFGSEHVMVDRGHGNRRGEMVFVKSMCAARVAKRLCGYLRLSREEAMLYD